MWLDIYEDFSELSKSEQMALFNAMKEDLFPDEPDKITELLKSIREARLLNETENIEQDNAIYVTIVGSLSTI